MKNIKISKNIYENLLIAISIMAFFILINFLYYKLNQSALLLVLKVFSMVIVILGIVLLEIAYRKYTEKIAINAMEVIVLAGHVLSIKHVVQAQNFKFTNYILVSSYAFSIYFLFKSICIYTKEKRDYLKSLSDIKEIVANKPIKKVATKKGEQK